MKPSSNPEHAARKPRPVALFAGARLASVVRDRLHRPPGERAIVSAVALLQNFLYGAFPPPLPPSPRKGILLMQLRSLLCLCCKILLSKLQCGTRIALQLTGLLNTLMVQVVW